MTIVRDHNKITAVIAVFRECIKKPTINLYNIFFHRFVKYILDGLIHIKKYIITIKRVINYENELKI